MYSIAVENISKTYGKVRALQDVSFSVAPGELFGLIGPDGAGKSTLFRILTTLILADSGSASVAGNDVVKAYKNIRKTIGYMPGTFSLYQDLTVQENLDFFAAIFGTSLQENYALIEDIYVQLEPFKDRFAGKLSGGMKQKLALCCALIHKPTVLFLDEPTTGVDAVSRVEFWEMLKKLKQKGITILVSTPYMDEASLCDRIALIQNGKILSINTPQKLITDFKAPLLALKHKDPYQLLQYVRTLPITDSVLPFGAFLHWVLNDTMSVEEIQKSYFQKEYSSTEIAVIAPSIEDVFLALSKDSN